MNLLKETLDVLASNNKTESVVLWVGIQRGDYEKRPSISFSWDEFAALADFEYDNGYGGAEIADHLKIVGADWWLERGEYDGAEWWEFKTLPTKPEYGKPCKADLEST